MLCFCPVRAVSLPCAPQAAMSGKQLLGALCPPGGPAGPVPPPKADNLENPQRMVRPRVAAGGESVTRCDAGGYHAGGGAGGAALSGAILAMLAVASAARTPPPPHPHPAQPPRLT